MVSASALVEFGGTEAQLHLRVHSIDFIDARVVVAEPIDSFSLQIVRAIPVRCPAHVAEHACINWKKKKMFFETFTSSACENG